MVAFLRGLDQSRQLRRGLRVELVVQQRGVSVELAARGAPFAGYGVGFERERARVLVERIERDQRLRVAQRFAGRRAHERIAREQGADGERKLAQPQPVWREPCEALEPRREPRLDGGEDGREGRAPVVGELLLRGRLAHQRLRLAHVDRHCGREPVPVVGALDQTLVAQLAAQPRQRHAQVVRGIVRLVDLGPDRIGNRRARDGAARMSEREVQQQLQLLAGETHFASADLGVAAEHVHGCGYRTRAMRAQHAQSDERREDLRIRAARHRRGRSEQLRRFDAPGRCEHSLGLARSALGREQQTRGVREHLQVRIAAAVRLARGIRCGVCGRAAVLREAHPEQMRHGEHHRRLEARVRNEGAAARRGEKRCEAALDPRDHHLFDVREETRETFVVTLRPRENRTVRQLIQEVVALDPSGMVLPKSVPDHDHGDVNWPHRSPCGAFLKYPITDFINPTQTYVPQQADFPN